MKKLYILFLLTAFPIIGFSQNIEYLFETLGDKEGWEQSGVTNTVADGTMEVKINDPAQGYQLTRSEGGLALAEANYVTLRMVVKNNAFLADGTTPFTTFDLFSYDTGTTTGGAAAKADFTIPAGAGYQIIDATIPVNPDNGGFIDRLAIRFKTGPGTLAASSNLDFQSITIVSTAVVITTYSGFVQDPNFDDVNGVIPNWTPSSGDITASASSTSNSGAQAAKVDIVNTLSGNVILWNDYTLAFDSPTTTAASGDNVVITWDMRSSSTNLEVSPRFKMGKTAGGNDLYTMAKKIVTVVDTYQSFSITKALNASEEYNDIYTLGFTITTANAGDNVYIDNVTTTVTINGITLSVNNIDYKDDASISIYPNPVQNILNVNASKEVLKIEVFNILGQKMLSKENSSTVDISNLNKGVYITKIFQENDVISTKRFIKE